VSQLVSANERKARRLTVAGDLLAERSSIEAQGASANDGSWQPEVRGDFVLCDFVLLIIPKRRRNFDALDRAMEFALTAQRLSS
jgi:hypothetical protein